MDKDELVHEIGAMLLDDEEIRSTGSWQHLAMVAQVTPEMTQVNGFLYLADGEVVPASPDNMDVMDRFEDLQEAMREPGKDVWRAALLRIDNNSKRLSIDFEYDNPEKWLINPGTVKRMGEALRPPAKA